jgi:hypothetical protein
MGITEKIKHIDIARIEVLIQQLINAAERKLLIHIRIERQFKLPMPVE